MELISRDKALMNARPEYLNPNQEKLASYNQGWNNAIEMYCRQIAELPTIEERKVGEWIRTGRTNVYGGEELICPFCGDRVMVQNIEYELYCRQCGALLGDRAKGE